MFLRRAVFTFCGIRTVDHSLGNLASVYCTLASALLSSLKTVYSKDLYFLYVILVAVCGTYEDNANGDLEMTIYFYRTYANGELVYCYV